MSVTRIYLLVLVVIGLSPYGVAVPLTIVNADFSGGAHRLSFGLQLPVLRR
jgi:hypothetical protein